jgi:MFS family permease
MTRQPLSPADRRLFEANLNKAYLYQFLMNFQLWWPIWVVYLTDKRGLSLTQITALDSVFWLIIVVAQVPAGAVADRWGRKSALLLASLFLSAGILVFGLADSYLLILISYAGWGLGLAFQYSAGRRSFRRCTAVTGGWRRRVSSAGCCWGRRWRLQPIFRCPS